MKSPETIGRYRIVRPLGRGGMGTVYLGVDSMLDRQVAIKVLGDLSDNDELRARFTREARAVAALQHRNIITIYEFGEADGHPFIAMEYLSGPSLTDIIRQTPPPPLDRRLQILIDVCDGLAYAHRAGVVHRDIKPANVMLLEDGTAKVLDFGVARMGADRSEMTAVGTMFGTPNYMSPEMIQGKTVDHRADIFAVGVVLYELLTGKKPFPGDDRSVFGVIQQVIRDMPPAPGTLVPGLPEALDTIVARAMEKAPERRYQRLDDLKADLVQVRDTLPAATNVEAAAPLMPPLADTPGRTEPTGYSTPLTRPRMAAVAPKPPLTPPPAQAPDPFEPTIIKAPPTLAPPAGAALGEGTVIIGPAAPHEEPKPEETSQVHLMVVRSADPRQAGQILPLAPAGRMVLGRDAHCDIVVNDAGLSRRHAAIEWRDGGFVILDLGSANGTFVNGKRVSGQAPEPLFFGATITIGETVLTLSYPRDTTLPDMSGVLVAGRYELEKLLRESAKASLYAARDRNVPRDVAVKLLSPELARYSGYIEQFEREARIAAQLQHPHVCQVLDSGLTRLALPGGRRFVETQFLCFELMAGGSLTARLKREDPVSLQDVHRWTTMLGSALQYAHEQDVVHGDLKPSAIVFDGAGNLYLTDFSIAQKALVEGRRTMGSPAFMAPELWDGETPTPATDQFGFAALVYFVLAGTSPFVGQDNPDIRRRNFKSGPAPVHEEAAQNGRTGVTRAVSDVLRRALSNTPAERFANVEQFTRTLLKALGTGRVTGAEPFVFISYDRELSGGWARFFADRLKLSHSIKVFMDATGIDRAGRFPPRLRRAIEDCDVFICFLAGGTLQSKWVSEEIRIAHELGKTMIPIFQESYRDPENVDEVSPVGALVAHQGIKLFDVGGHFVEHAVTDLAQMVKGVVSGESDYA